MMEHESISSEPRIMLLEQKKIQDAIAAVVLYIPSVVYVVTSLVYAPLMFVVQESRLRAVVLAFLTQLSIVCLLFALRGYRASRTQRYFEMVALRRPSAPESTADMIWGDRLAELRNYTQYKQRSQIFALIEYLSWCAFALVVYFLARASVV